MECFEALPLDDLGEGDEEIKEELMISCPRYRKVEQNNLAILFPGFIFISSFSNCDLSVGYLTIEASGY